jgi:hypothetical protein
MPPLKMVINAARRPHIIMAKAWSTSEVEIYQVHDLGPNDGQRGSTV